MKTKLLLLAVALFAATSCSLTQKADSRLSSHQKFSTDATYPATYEIFRNEELLNIATSSNSRILVDLSDQRTQLIVNEQVALDAPCCTGRPGKRTPTGSFRIMEKIQNKRSNIFGTLYQGGTRVYGGDRRKYSGSYSKFVGSPLPYWMRVTGDGIGFHFSQNVKRVPASAGCIRMTTEGVTALYSKVSKGTKVTIQN